MNENYDQSLKPITPWGYVGYEFLFAIPIIGFIFLLIYAISAKNQNLKNFARAQFCMLLLAVIFSVIAYLLGFEVPMP